MKYNINNVKVLKVKVFSMNIAFSNNNKITLIKGMGHEWANKWGSGAW